jgi:hypothetical protein
MMFSLILTEMAFVLPRIVRLDEPSQETIVLALIVELPYTVKTLLDCCQVVPEEAVCVVEEMVSVCAYPITEIESPKKTINKRNITYIFFCDTKLGNILLSHIYLN